MLAVEGKRLSGFTNTLQHPAAVLLDNDSRKATARWWLVRECDQRYTVNHGNVLSQRANRVNLNVNGRFGVFRKER